MTANQTLNTRLKQWPIKNFWWLRRLKHVKIVERWVMHIFAKDVYKWANLVKEGKNSIQDKYRTGRRTKTSTPEMMDSSNVLIFLDKNYNRRNFWMTEKFFGCNTQSIHDDLDFSKVSCCWISPGQFKVLYCNMNSGNHQSVTTSSLQSRFDPF